jgi:hypothetical protein
VVDEIRHYLYCDLALVAIQRHSLELATWRT